MVVDNFDMGQRKFALGVAGNHKAARIQIDFVEQAEFDRIGHHPAFENQMESRVQPGAQNWVELVRRQPFECPIEQLQKDVL